MKPSSTLSTTSKPKLIILVTKESDGYTYYLSWSQREIIQSMDKNRKIRKLFLTNDVKEPFAFQHKRIYKEIIPLVTGLQVSLLKKSFDEVKFVNVDDGTTLAEFSFSGGLS